MTQGLAISFSILSAKELKSEIQTSLRPIVTIAAAL